MLGIFAFMAMGFCVSLMLPDGADDGELNHDSSLDATDPDLELNGENDLLSKIDVVEDGIVILKDGATNEFSESLEKDYAISDHENVEIESLEADLMGGSSSPYENDIDLSAFEKVEFAGDSNSTLLGTNNDDFLVGGSGSDFVVGEAGNDVIFGGTGSDTLDGGTGSDLVVACTNPIVADSAAASELYGGAGDDTLIGENDDRLTGGSGIDFFNVFSGCEMAGPVAHITDFDAENEFLLIEVRDDQIGGELDYALQQTDSGVEILVDNIPVVFLEGVMQTEDLKIAARSVGA